MNMPCPRPLVAALVLGLLTASVASCSKPTPPPPREKASPEAPGSASLAPSGSASAALPAATSALPMLVLEPLLPPKRMSLFPIEGALIVVDGLRVGRIVDEHVEWFATLPETVGLSGPTGIERILGAWPDDVDVVTSQQGRAPEPHIAPLTGKGASFTFAVGGGLGTVTGVAKVGKTTVVGGDDMTDGLRIQTLRGPPLAFNPISGAKGGCKPEELQETWRAGAAIAVPFTAIAATENGTLVTIGKLCGRDQVPAAEVWDQPGSKSRIIDLSGQLKYLEIYPHLLKGKGDDLWLASYPVLHYSGGKFAALPSLESPWRNLFVSPAGKLHGLQSRTIYRYDEEKWTPIAKLAWPMWLAAVGMDEKGTLWVEGSNGVARLREQSAADSEQACTTPFVYLYTVSWKNETKYSFPTTRKALSTFPEVADLRLVEYFEDVRTLGVQVKSWAQGEALIAHVTATMKDEHPELICYVPKKPRVIEMNARK
jgi:hypothetical protein